MSKVGGFDITWITAPTGVAGVARARVSGAGVASQEMELRYRSDDQGVWIEFPTHVRGFDVQAVPQDDAPNQYLLVPRIGSFETLPARAVKPGEESQGGTMGGKKKAPKIKAQMPGKIVRVLVKEGGLVEKDMPLLVMEAMKMENEIKAPQNGKIAKIKVVVGQAVESGAELVLYE